MRPPCVLASVDALSVIERTELGLMPTSAAESGAPTKDRMVSSLALCYRAAIALLASIYVKSAAHRAAAAACKAHAAGQARSSRRLSAVAHA